MKTELFKCNNCDWVGEEEELYLVEFDLENLDETPTASEDSSGYITRYFEEPLEVDFLKGCPNCLTDKFLIDL